MRDFEPKVALTPGGDGLAAYRIITAQAQEFLNPSGILMVEIGFDQGPAVLQMFHDAGFTSVTLDLDLNGRDRVVSGKKPV